MAKAPLLIVDDEPQNLAALRQILADERPLVFARSGADALAGVRKHRPALVLLDIEMPDMSGYEVCRQLKSDSALATIPVIFVTSLSEMGREAEGFAVGAVDYIVKPVSAPTVLARVRTHLSLVQHSRLERSYVEAIYMLGKAGHFNDSDTGVHIWRMASFAGALARAAGWDAIESRMLELAAPMHDTGKIGVPDAILRKPGKLDADEWDTMRAHTRIGHDILAGSEAPVFRLATEVALRHHEKWDGSGYPDGLAGDEIPESARIVAVADVFDALTMRRPYKEAWTVEQATARMRADAGTHFEPRLVELFISIQPEILELKTRWDAREAHSEDVFLNEVVKTRAG